MSENWGANTDIRAAVVLPSQPGRVSEAADRSPDDAQADGPPELDRPSKPDDRVEESSVSESSDVAGRGVSESSDVAGRGFPEDAQEDKALALSDGSTN